MKPALGPPEEGEVSGLNQEGAGVLRDGKTVFVPGALPGERVRYQRRARHRQHDEGELLELLRSAPDRVAPRCPHFGVCGGCALQHLDPSAQLALKQREVAEALRRIGRCQPLRWLEPLRGPVWNYRRRARLGVKYVVKKDRVLVGFRERRGRYVAELTGCEVLAPPVNRLFAPLAKLIGSLSIRERLPQIEVAIADLTVLVMRVLAPPSVADRELLAKFERDHECRIVLQSGGLDSVVALDGSAAPTLRYPLPEFGLDLEFRATDFIQINAEVNRLLIGFAIDQLGSLREARVLDLFCGLGNFTLPLATRATSVTGIDGDAGLVECARRNARRHGLGNADFHVADLMDGAVADASWARGPFTHVLLDPPRAGAREVLPLVAGLAPRRVVYISCHPGSLARDVGLLVHEHGMRLLAAGVVDMFPQTTHIESVAILEPGGRSR
jgi:23S rRNA (uracil1939-C5)-methyltransferase